MSITWLETKPSIHDLLGLQKICNPYQKKNQNEQTKSLIHKGRLDCKREERASTTMENKLHKSFKETLPNIHYIE